MTTHRTGRRTRKHRGVRIVKLADGRHVARWTDPGTGKARQESLDRLGLTNELQREQWCVAKVAEIHAARKAWSLAGGKPEPRTIAEALADYQRAKPVAPRTASARKGGLDELAAYCEQKGIKRADSLTAPKLWGWRDEVVNRTDLEESTRNLRLATVAAFLRWAATRDLVPLLPGDKVRALCARIDQPRKAIEYLRPAQLRRVLEAGLTLDQETRAKPKGPGFPRREVAPVLLILATSGMRWQEVSGLDWQEVDFEAGEIRLPPERVKIRQGRTITWRETPTLGMLLRALHRRAGAPTAGLVLAPPWRPQGWRAHEQRVRERAEVFVTPHILRRTVGTILTCAGGIYGGASAWQSAKRLGHSVMIAERHYASALSGLPADARTLEDAAGIGDVALAIVQAVGQTGGQ